MEREDQMEINRMQERLRALAVGARRIGTMAAALEREANTLERRLAMLNHPAGKNRSNNSGLDDILAAGPQIPNNVLDMFQASDTIGEPPVEKRDSDE